MWNVYSLWKFGRKGWSNLSWFSRNSCHVLLSSPVYMCYLCCFPLRVVLCVTNMISHPCLTLSSSSTTVLPLLISSFLTEKFTFIPQPNNFLTAFCEELLQLLKQSLSSVYSLLICSTVLLLRIVWSVLWISQSKLDVYILRRKKSSILYVPFFTL